MSRFSWALLLLGHAVAQNTSALSKQELLSRTWRFSIPFIVAGLLLVLLAIAAVHYKKTGVISIGPFSYSRADGFQRSLCLGEPGGPYEAMTSDSVPEIGADTVSAVTKTPELPGAVGASAPPEEKPPEVPAEKALAAQVGPWHLWRSRTLVMMFVIYIATSVGVPLWKRRTASCENGFFWEDHMPFLLVTVSVKILELGIYALDSSITGELDWVTFFLKFLPSILGFVDGYTDATAITIVAACDSELAHNLTISMLTCYIIGVVLTCLQGRQPCMPYEATSPGCSGQLHHSP